LGGGDGWTRFGKGLGNPGVGVSRGCDIRSVERPLLVSLGSPWAPHRSTWGPQCLPMGSRWRLIGFPSVPLGLCRSPSGPHGVPVGPSGARGGAYEKHKETNSSKKHERHNLLELVSSVFCGERGSLLVGPCAPIGSIGVHSDSRGGGIRGGGGKGRGGELPEPWGRRSKLAYQIASQNCLLSILAQLLP